MNNLLNISNFTIDTIIKKKYCIYAKYTILHRVLPNIYDGLKPVQRRIIYSLYKLNLLSTSKFKKSTKMVGDVIAKYHPHGDNNVYESAIRLSQWWKTNQPLIDVQGNNGSIDGDNPAALRYTEMKMTKYSDKLIELLKYQTTTNYTNNFDDSEVEPLIIPTIIPNLFINGNSGVAVGIKTNIAPHNLNEIINCFIKVIDNSKISLNRLLKVFEGPDYPTEGYIEFIDDVANIYKNGEGKINLYANCDVKIDKKCNYIVVTNIPYNVKKTNIVNQIQQIIANKSILGINDCIDQSENNMIKIVIYLSKNHNPYLILEQLFLKCGLKNSYFLQFNCIANNKPKQISLIDYLTLLKTNALKIYKNIIKENISYIKHELIILNVLKKIEKQLKECILIIIKSKNKKNAIDNIKDKYNLSSIEANYIVSLKLYKLTKENINIMLSKQAELTLEKNRLELLLKNENNIFNNIKKDLLKIQNNFKIKRKTINATNYLKEIESNKNNYNNPKTENKKTNLYISNDGYYWKINNNEDKNDLINNKNIIYFKKNIDNDEKILLIFQSGEYLLINVNQLKNSANHHLNNELNISLFENKIINIFNIKNYNDKYFIFFVSEFGYVQKINVDLLKNDKNEQKLIKIVKIKQSNDKIIKSFILSNQIMNQKIYLLSKNGYLIKYNHKLIKDVNLKSYMIKGINLTNDKIIDADVCDNKLLNIYNNKLMSKQFNLENISDSIPNTNGVKLFSNTKYWLLFSYKVDKNNLYKLFINDFYWIFKNTITLKIINELKKNINLKNNKNNFTIYKLINIR